MLRILILVLAPSLSFAGCPPPPDIGAAETEVLVNIRNAKSEGEARVLSNRLWELWARAPDQKAQEMLDRGMSARASWDFASAIDALNALVEYCPDYAEGYNQRAFVNFLRQDYAPALEDLDRAIARSPRHVAAIAGKALTLMGMGRDDEAQLVLRDAVRMNPWLSERRLLTIPMDEEI